MKKVLQKIFIPVSIVWYVALMIAGFLAYFIKLEGPNGFTDGLGRLLKESPIIMRVLFGQDYLWAGFGWFFTDSVIFFGSIAAGLGIWGLISDD